MKLQMPHLLSWVTKRWRVFTLALLALLALVFFLGLGVRSLKTFNEERTEGRIREALDAEDFDTATQLLNRALANRPGALNLRILQARLGSFLNPRLGALLWREVWPAAEGDPEVGVAFAVALIAEGEMGLVEAGTVVETLEKRHPDSDAYHRAALALRFAEGDDARAGVHAAILRSRNPESEENQLNWAIIAVRATDPERVAEAVGQLQHLAGSGNAQALRVLALHFAEQADSDGFDALLSSIETGSFPSTAASRLWMLEAKSMLQRPWTLAEVEAAFEAIGRSSDGDLFLQFLFWMESQALEREAVSWVIERDLVAAWGPRTGIVLARFAASTHQSQAAVQALSRADWGNWDAMRLLWVAWLEDPMLRRRFWIDQALDRADSTLPQGVALLLPMVRRMAWVEGELAVMLRLLIERPLAPRELRLLFSQLQELGRTESVLALTQGLLRHYPDEAVFLNDAAYLNALLGRGLEGALAGIQRARTLAPDSPDLRSTEAFVLYRLGRKDEAASIVQTLETGRGALVRRLLQNDGLLPLPSGESRVSHVWTFPEERRLAEGTAALGPRG